MDFSVRKRRLDGRPLCGPAATGHGARGLLRITEERVDPMNRWSRVARLHGPDEKVLPNFAPLHDAQLVFANPEMWLLSGYELGSPTGTEVCFGQTWLMVPGPVEDRDRAMARFHSELVERYPQPTPLGGRSMRYTLDLRREVSFYLESIGDGSIERGITEAVRRLRGLSPAPPRLR